MSNGTIIEGLAALFRNGWFNNWDAVALSWGSLTSMASTNDFNLSEIWKKISYVDLSITFGCNLHSENFEA